MLVVAPSAGAKKLHHRHGEAFFAEAIPLIFKDCFAENRSQ
jgi:hypothetical protein